MAPSVTLFWWTQAAIPRTRPQELELEWVTVCGRRFRIYRRRSNGIPAAGTTGLVLWEPLGIGEKVSWIYVPLIHCLLMFVVGLSYLIYLDLLDVRGIVKCV